MNQVLKLRFQRQGASLERQSLPVPSNLQASAWTSARTSTRLA